MRSTILVLALTLAATAGCARQASAPRTAQPTATQSAAPKQVSAPATGTAADGDYYRERAAAIAKESPNELARTDFTRLRRGRLQALGAIDSASEEALQKRLSEALGKEDLAAVLEVTLKILAEDQADIRAHILRATALRKTSRIPEADFHRDVARGLIESIVKTGDGHGFKTAWTVYRVKEEYEILKVLGCAVVSQALARDGDRMFDVLEARRIEGGETIRVYFDITELIAEEQKLFSGK